MKPSRVSYAPQIPLLFSLSPLLSGVTSDVLPCALSTTRVIPPLRVSSFASSRSQIPIPRCIVTPPDADDKPLPPLPLPHIPPTQIIRVLDLLEQMDDDITDEVHRVKGSIREARALVREVKEERREHQKQFRLRYDKEQQETGRVEGEFWDIYITDLDGHMFVDPRAPRASCAASIGLQSRNE
ncbi:hypothetical protein AcW1_009081 [Taiwanofungus camphoratus]|nr:hypothetical protein AcV5_007102 [Antrodia cinnamomea]KAI0949477.1 hypothetical protein AcW1_009081 [Antrodia cinnamomea]KAI0958713.1 hypothetical protein AcV7_004448 [Antrodia cinnamomea]